MKETVRIDLHCHSIFSDGELSPEALAERLASSGVEYAALTDHDSVDGVPRFHEALRRFNIGFLPGVEITATFQGLEIHLLGYGIDIHFEELRSTLLYLRHKRMSRMQGPLRRVPAHHPPAPEGEAAPGVAETGKIDIREAISLVHRAGGRAFFAHPLTSESRPEVLDRLIATLRDMGLDGIEVISGSGPATDQEVLRETARRHDLLVSGGTDFHDPGGTTASQNGVDMPAADWKDFVRSVHSAPNPASSRTGKQESPKGLHDKRETDRLWFLLRPRIVLPSLLAIVLFITTIWGMILPAIESILLDRKRDMIRELTNITLSLLAEAEREERAGMTTRDEAREKAKSQIGALRYGREGKDYFWIQDMQPRILMHPYRSDLNGRDVSGFMDPRGIRIFVEFADIVRRQEMGFVEYVWQWQDDPERLMAKESYVRGFEPWGWVIGTGMYVDDVRQEIKRIERNIVYTLTAIVILVFLVLLYNIRQSLNVEKKRIDMQESLREAEARYRSLIEATTEGTLLILGGRCRYANPTLLNMTGYTAERLELLTLSDLLPRDSVNEDVWKHIEEMPAEAAGSKSFEAMLTCADGARKDCIITLNPILIAEHPGIIVLAKDVFPVPGQEGSIQKLGQAARSAAVGIFQAKAGRRGIITAMNPAARLLFQELNITPAEPFALADLFDDDIEYDEVCKVLRNHGDIRDRVVRKTSAEGGTRVLSLSVVRMRDDHGEPLHDNCVVTEITERALQESEREAFMEKLGTSLLFLQEPIGKPERAAVTCPLETPVHKAATLMSTRDTSCIVVETDTGAPVGFVTDHDFRRRVVGRPGADLQAPVRTIMSAPLITISENARIYEALMLMEENHVRHLAVKDADGDVTGVIRASELLRFHRYGPMVLSSEISKAGTHEDVERCCKRFPSLVKALIDAGAKPRTVAHMASAVCDAATVRFIELAIETLGPPPVPFAFIAMGSQGRREQTLLTDQDNAIIYQQESPTERETVSDYFLTLGASVSEWLDRSGYAFCGGGVMAGNRDWCRSLPEWKEKFSEWMLKAEPRELLDFSICLDFRPVYGAAEMAYDLRRYIYGILKDRPSFLPHLAQNALLFKPPARFLGKIIKGGGPREEAGRLNIKETLMPVIGFGRLYALRHRMPLTHTMERIEALVYKGLMEQSACDAVATAYDVLMRMRFQAQLSRLQEGRPLDNHIVLNRLGHMDEAMLKQAFSQIESLQKKIVYDFLGGAEWPGA